jgi:hypothetical protein
MVNISSRDLTPALTTTLASDLLGAPLARRGCVLPQSTSNGFIRDVLDVYTQPADSRHPQVCFGESPEQLVSETRCHCLEISHE